MRLLVICGKYPSISETFISGHVEGLIQAGHAVTVLARGGVNNILLDDIHPTIKPNLISLDSDTEQFGQRLLKRLKLAIKRPMLAAKAFMAGEQIQSCLMLSELEALHCISKAVNEWGKFDVAHIHFGIHGVWAERLKRVFPFARASIVTFHGFDVWSVKPTTYDAYRELAKEPVLVTANSQFTFDRVLSFGFSRDKTRIWRMGVDVGTTPLSAFKTSKPDEIRIVSVGRLAPVKGHDDLIRAIAKAQDLCSENLTLRIVGGGGESMIAQLRLIAEECGIKHRISFEGALSHRCVWEILRSADLFALASKVGPGGAREGLGVALLEASAMGLPILSTRSGGIPDAVIDGVTGLLARENDVEDLANKLVMLIQQREYWPEYGLRGREHVLSEFTREQTTKRIIELYEESLSLAQ